MEKNKEEIRIEECKDNCDWYYFCYAVSNYCPLKGNKLHGTPKLTQEFKSKIIAIGLIDMLKEK